MRKQKNREDIVQLLLDYDLEEERNIVNAKGLDGWTPLHCCAFKGNTAQLTLLVNSKHKDPVQLDIQTEKDGFTPLILAASKSHIDAVWLLINRYCIITPIYRNPLYLNSTANLTLVLLYHKQRCESMCDYLCEQEYF